MKKQINPTIKAHLIRGAFYLLLLLAVCAIPFALAQRKSAKPGVANPASNANTASQANSGSRLLPYDAPYDVPGVAARQRISQFPQKTSGARAAHVLPIPRPPKGPQQVVLYDQYNNAGTNATTDATFSDLTGFDSDLADDFVVPAGQTWNVESIDADGTYFNGSGPANSFNVFIYTDNAGLPGTQIFSTLDQPVSQVGTTFTVTLSPAAVLSEGTYWIEIQANMTFSTEGQWGWTDRTVQSNSAAAWQNPGGGFATACTTWGQRGATCNIDPGVPDQVWRINGTVSGSTPTATPTAIGTATPTATAIASATPTASPACTPIVIQGSIELTDPTQTDHLNRSGNPQTCPATTSCAIFGDGLLHHYDSYTFTNTSASDQCVTIDTNSTCIGVRFIFTAAYLGSFDPNNICTNWIGDSGISPDPDAAFQVDVPAGQSIVVVVSNVTSDGTCPAYTLTVTGLCGFTPSPTPTASPTPTPTGTPTATVTPTGTPCGTPIVINDSIELTDPTQMDHLARSGVAQTCPATTTCAIDSDGLLHHYDAFTFVNTTGTDQCVTIDTNSTCIGVRFIFTAAYLGSFDPNNICSNWIGDSGFSPDPDAVFQVDVPAGQTLVVVVSNVTAAGTCPAYTLTITGLCTFGTPSPTPTASPTLTATPTATATATATTTGSVTPTPTGRPSPTPRVAPTPRPRPTPAPRP